MNRNSAIARFFLALCALGLFCGQVFGVVKGYMCDCSGQPIAVQDTSCVGPHGANCHPQGSDASVQKPSKESKDSSGGDRKEHHAVTETIKSSSAPATTIIVPAAMVLAILPVEILLAPEPIQVSFAAYADHCALPPLSISVTRTVVRLI